MDEALTGTAAGSQRRAALRPQREMATQTRSAPLKVLFVASSYPRYAGDTSSIFLRTLAAALRDRGIEIRVLAPDSPGPTASPIEGIAVSRFRYFPRAMQSLAYGSGMLPNIRESKLRAVQVPAFMAAMFVALRRETVLFSPDVVHAHWIVPQGLVAAAARRSDTPRLVVTAHGGDAFALGGRASGAMKRYVLRHCDRWTANTRATAAAVTGDPPDPRLPAPAVIPMGVDCARFSGGDRTATRARLGIAGDEDVAIFVGRLVEKKGADDLVRAFAAIARSGRRPRRLLLAGDGTMRAALEQLAAASGAADRITFLGRIENERLPDYLAAADLFVGPSVVAGSGDTEGMGVVFLEAHAAGLAVVGTRTGGISEVVEHGTTGELVPPRSVHELAAAIDALLSDPARRAAYAARARNTVRARYDVAVVAGRFHALYLSTLHRHRAGAPASGAAAGREPNGQ